MGSGSYSPSSSSSESVSEAESSPSWNGKRPVAISMSEMPRDQTSDLMVYAAPWMRSGCMVSIGTD